MTLNTDTVLASEAEWLSTSGDSLPVLLKNAVTDTDAPFDVIQPYWPDPTDANRAIYVCRRSFSLIVQDSGFQIPRHMIVLKVRWPLGGGTADSTDVSVFQREQADLDAAVELVTQRVLGFPHDKRHGGRFLSVAEPNVGYGQPSVTVTFADAERQAQSAERCLRAEITYSIDDEQVSA